MLQNSVRSRNLVTCIKTKQNKALLRFLYSERSFGGTCRPLTPAICVILVLSHNIFHSNEEVGENHMEGADGDI